jgi:hypothetical protein
MKNTDKSMCEKLELYFDGELDEHESCEFQLHLEFCESCRKELDELGTIRASLQSFTHIQLPDESDLRIRRNLRTGSDQLSTRDEILDIEGVARFLKVSVTDVVDILDQLPSFEVGGKIRFRRDRIIEWIKDQEKKLVREREEHLIPSHKNIVQFPGGKS